jgi:hypothetical protein
MKRARRSHAAAFAVSVLLVGCGARTWSEEVPVQGSTAPRGMLDASRDVIEDRPADRSGEAPHEEESPCTPTSCSQGEACNPATGLCSGDCFGGLVCTDSCCNENTCEPGTDVGACGAVGQACANCFMGCPDGGACTPSCRARVCSFSLKFGYTGAEQDLVVPAGVTHVTISAYGAAGGAPSSSFSADHGIGGEGGSTTATISVTPGETLAVFVGGAGIATSGTGGMGGFGGGGVGYMNGAGGGGASDVRQGGTALANRVVVAGGGGGGASGNGGAGGALFAGLGDNGSGGIGGGPGAQTGGGLGGTEPGCAGMAGTLGVGGASSAGGGGGGGGGYYGGGGGCGYHGGGGGGGSSFAVPTATGVSTLQGGQVGNGRVIITLVTVHARDRRIAAVGPFPTLWDRSSLAV